MFYACVWECDHDSFWCYLKKNKNDKKTRHFLIVMSLHNFPHKNTWKTTTKKWTIWNSVTNAIIIRHSGDDLIVLRKKILATLFLCSNGKNLFKFLRVLFLPLMILILLLLNSFSILSCTFIVCHFKSNLFKMPESVP